MPPQREARVHEALEADELAVDLLPREGGIAVLLLEHGEEAGVEMEVVAGGGLDDLDGEVGARPTENVVGPVAALRCEGEGGLVHEAGLAQARDRVLEGSLIPEGDLVAIDPGEVGAEEAIGPVGRSQPEARAVGQTHFHVLTVELPDLIEAAIAPPAFEFDEHGLLELGIGAGDHHPTRAGPRCGVL